MSMAAAAIHPEPPGYAQLEVEDWDIWIAEGLSWARRLEVQGHPRVAAKLRAYVDRRTAGTPTDRQPCVRMRCSGPALPGRPWCHRHGPVFADEAAAVLARAHETEEG